MTTTPVPPDAELVTVDYLRRTGSRVRALVSDRVYTIHPKNPTYPMLRAYQFDAVTVRSVPLHLRAAAIQLDAYGESKADARRLIDTALAELADMADATHTGAVVSLVRFTFGPRFEPDETFEPAKHRYIAGVEVYIHPT